MVYIGIDPGQNGGISVISENSTESHVYSSGTLIDVLSQARCAKVVLEKVSAMPKQGVSSTFKFGQNYGYIMGVLEAFDIAYELVPPQKWKREFSCTADKNTSIAVAQRLFPDIDLRATERCKKPHDGKAESLLMAEYARRHMK